MNIAIVNGPNLNLLGKREPEVYGTQSFEDFLLVLTAEFPDVSFAYMQSNVEGELISGLHDLDKTADVILLNAGGYTHTSVALADAVAGIDTPVIEIHISNIFAREDYRHVSYIGKHCKGSVSGFGLSGYRLGVLAAMNSL
jgi:3-dehydroquinate dehydratase-2